jgi:hypothetical protein
MAPMEANTVEQAGTQAEAGAAQTCHLLPQQKGAQQEAATAEAGCMVEEAEAVPACTMPSVWQQGSLTQPPHALPVSWGACKRCAHTAKLSCGGMSSPLKGGSHSAVGVARSVSHHFNSHPSHWQTFSVAGLVVTGHQPHVWCRSATVHHQGKPAPPHG